MVKGEGESRSIGVIRARTAKSSKRKIEIPARHDVSLCVTSQVWEMGARDTWWTIRLRLYDKAEEW